MTTIPAENLLVSRAGLLAGPGVNVQTQGPTHAGTPTNPEEQGSLTTTPLDSRGSKCHPGHTTSEGTGDSPAESHRENSPT